MVSEADRHLKSLNVALGAISQLHHLDINVTFDVGKASYYTCLEIVQQIHQVRHISEFIVLASKQCFVSHNALCVMFCFGVAIPLDFRPWCQREVP